MSENLYIGLSREQIEKLLAGEEVGKRPYFQGITYKMSGKRYADVRVYVRLLSNLEEIAEPEHAFDW